MHLPRKWINSDRVSSLLLYIFFLNTLNPKGIIIINNNNINHKAETRRHPSSHMVFGALLMIVALAVVGTKRLAFGITLSAFVLLVLEYVGGSFSFSFSRLQFILQSLADLGFQSEQVSSSSSNNLFEFETGEDDDDGGDDDSSVYTTTTSSGEIDTGRVDHDRNVTIRNVMDEKKKKKKTGGQGDLALTDEASGIKRRRSRRGIFDSKIMRKLVPKKLRLPKNHQGSEGKFGDHSASVKVKEGDASVGNLTIRQVMSELQSESEECECLDRKQSGDLSRGSHHSLDHEADCVIFGSGQCNELVTRCDSPIKLVTSDIQIGATGKSGYVMLVVIVLAGLVGGRIVAFLLAIGYCCIFKYICTLRQKDLTSRFLPLMLRDDDDTQSS